MSIGFKFTGRKGATNFLDRGAVMDAVPPAERRIFTRFGGFVRTSARRSIRPSIRISQPGSPPSDHVGFYRRQRNRKNKKLGLEQEKGGGVPGEGIRFILFGYEPTRHSVIIGPASTTGQAKVPSLLEKGGTARITRKGKEITAHYKPRPFMGPAFKLGLDKLPGFLAGSVRKRAA